MERKYKKVEFKELEEKKKKLEEIRSFKEPIDKDALREHADNYEKF